MAKRASKAEAQLILLLIIIGLPIYVIYQFGEAIGWWWVGIGTVVIIVVYFWYRAAQEKARKVELERQEKQRREELLEKYGDEKLVEDIMAGKVWQGQTPEQLEDSLGSPVDIDEKVLKTKKKEIWKYQHRGGNRYGVRITLENDVVVGWEEKS